jgi:hypothetical protein
MMAWVVDLSAARQQLEQHRGLRTKAASLRKLVELCPPSPAENPTGQELQDRWRRELLGALAHLDATLRAHFAHEEASPLYSDPDAQFARFQPELTELIEEHERLLDLLEQLRSEVSPKHALMLAKDTEAFLNLLRAHEEAENRILAAAYGEDLGVGD